MSLPIGTPIVVTTTAKNGEVGKFFGRYYSQRINGQDQFILRPLPGKHSIEQLPMYKNQPHGWEYEYPPEGKEGVDPHQELVDVKGLFHMMFTGVDRDPFTWTLLEDDPYMRAHAFTSTTDEEGIREDIAKATQNPYNLYTLTNRKDHRVILSAVRRDPYILEDLTDEVTPEFIQKLTDENTKWLSYLPKTVKTDPNFLKIVIEHKPSYITEVPLNMLTEELIRNAFTTNPNIIHLESMTPKLRSRIQAQIQDYEDAPIPPYLERQISATHTDQGNQGVCGRHAFSRVIVKNFFELILPLQSTQKDCNKFLATTSLGLSNLTPQKCSFSGYIKILLFLHCFFLFQKYISTVEGRPTGWLECVQVSALYKHLYTSIEIPTITHDQFHDLQDALYTVQTVQKKYNISLVTFHFKDITMDNIRKITDHGLYIMLRVEDSKSANFHAAHFVIIVGAFDQYMLVKNSWEKDTIYKIKFGHPFYLGKYTYDVLTDCSFVIPVQQTDNEEFGDLTHVDSYLQRYAELKTKFNGIVVNVINACPSKNKEPVECAENPFRQQAIVFHPDKNPRCRKEAESKFQKLMTLKGCRHESPAQRVHLISKGGKKRVRKTRRRGK